MKRAAISVRGLVRLLPATYHKPPALRGLVDTDDDLEILAEIEGLTRARLLAERGRSPHLDPRELAWHLREAGVNGRSNQSRLADLRQRFPGVLTTLLEE